MKEEVLNKKQLLEEIHKTVEGAGENPVILVIYFANGECMVSHLIEQWENNIQLNYDDELRPVSGDENLCIEEVIVTIDDGTMDFGEAISALKDGHRVARRGWNGKEQYIELGTEFTYRRPNSVVENAVHQDIGSKAIVFCGTRGRQVGWLASQSDMLAEDWYIADEQ